MGLIAAVAMMLGLAVLLVSLYPYAAQRKNILYNTYVYKFKKEKGKYENQQLMSQIIVLFK